MRFVLSKCVVALITIATSTGVAIGQTTLPYSDIHDFATATGDTRWPGTNLSTAITFDPTGNMIGGAFSDGSYAEQIYYGVIWKMTPLGAYSVLHGFGGPVTYTNGKPVAHDGNNPGGRLTYDKAGNLYGTAYLGGGATNGMLWELTASGEYFDLHDFGNWLDPTQFDGENPEAGVTLDSNGNMYGTATEGGDKNYGDGVVWEITSDGTYKILHNFGGNVTLADGTTGTDGSYPGAEVSLDSSGNLYGTNSRGVWEITKSGTYIDLHDFPTASITYHDGTTGPDGYAPLGMVYFDANGNRYGTVEYGAEYISGMLWEITQTGIYIDLYDFGGLVTLANGMKGYAGGYPHGEITTDSLGNKFGASLGCIWELTNSGTFIDLHDFGGTVTTTGGQVVPDGGAPVSGVSFDAAGNLYGVAEAGGANGLGMIWKLGNAVAIQGIATTSSLIQGSLGATGTVYLSGPAPTKGLAVTLTSSNPAVKVPPTATILANTASIAFPITTTVVSVLTSSTVTATIGSKSQSITIEVKPATVAKLAISPTSVYGGATSTGTITLSGPSGPSGSVIALSSNNTAATVPATVTTAGNATSVAFTIHTVAVSSPVNVTITAKTGAVSSTGVVEVLPAPLASVVLSSSTAIGGSAVTGSVYLSGVGGPSGIPVAVSSTADASTPTTVTVPSGLNKISFTISTSPVNANVVATITAKLGSVTKTAALEVIPATVTKLAISPTPVYGGATSTGTITLSGQAGPSGDIINITSNNAAATAQAAVKIASNGTVGSFPIKTIAVNVPTTVTIGVSLSSSTASQTLTVLPALSLVVKPLAVVGGTNSDGIITLSAPAPAGGAIVTISSSSKNAVVQAAVRVLAGALTAGFPIKTLAVTKLTTVDIYVTYGGSTVAKGINLSPPG
jgi:hypothetical protein